MKHKFKLPTGRNAQCLTCGSPFEDVSIESEFGRVTALSCGHDVTEQLRQDA